MAKKIPDFETYAEEADFWAKADAIEYTEPADIKVTLDPSLKKNLRPITIRLRNTQVDALKAIAGKHEMRYQTMLRSWISERIREELAKDPK